MRLSVGIEAINSYKRLSYTTWHALSEFVDNSTQAYFDNREVLDEALKREGARLFVSILYDRDTQTIAIRDNAIGMSEAELEDALLIASRPPRPNGRSRYGMGMKTAACWFGDLWTVKTKKLGEPEAVSVTVDVPIVASGQADLTPERTPEDPHHHYTEIIISKLHRRIQGRAVRVIKDYLRSIYRCDLRNGVIEFIFQGEELSWEGFEDRILRDNDGQLYRRDLDFTVMNRRVTGWVAVLGSGGRPYGGFSILQNNRVLKGYPDSWRPRLLFGQEEGSNDLVNQRLCGELHLDGFEVNHTKDGINWQDDEEEVIEKALLEYCEDYRQVARKMRKGDRRGPSQIALDNAVNQVAHELNSGEMIDIIELTEIPPETVLEQTRKQIVAHAARGNPRIDVQVGDVCLKFFIDSDADPMSHYYAIDWLPDRTLIIAINRNHHYMVQLGDDVADFIRQCIYDGIAEFKATQKRGKVTSDTIRYFKDQLLRVPYKLHDDAPDIDTE